MEGKNKFFFLAHNKLQPQIDDLLHDPLKFGPSMQSKRILVIIPAFNEEEAIGEVIHQIKLHLPFADLLVVNDASTDQTQFILEEHASVTAIHLPMNLGIGGCVQTGFRYAVEHEYDIAIQFDGDGQHKAADLPHLIEALEHQQADVIIGSRFLGKRKGYTSSVSRRLGIFFIRTVARSLGHVDLTDCTSGLRVYNKAAFRFLAQDYPANFPEPEAIILLGRNGYKIKEVPTEILPRLGGKSSITSSNSLFYMVRVILGMFMTALRPKDTAHE